MKNMISAIAGLSRADYKEFCTWLVECCGMTISDLIDRPPCRQRDAYFQWLAECRSDFEFIDVLSAD